MKYWRLAIVLIVTVITANWVYSGISCHKTMIAEDSSLSDESGDNSEYTEFA